MDMEQAFSYLEERFGVTREIFKDLEFFEKSKGRVFALNRGSAGFLDKVKPISFGLLFGRKHAAFKPSSVIIQIFGKAATKNVCAVDNQQAKDYISGLDLDVKGAGNCTDGYVILKYKDYPLGIGLLKNGRLKNMLQKGKRTMIELEPLASVKTRED